MSPALSVSVTSPTFPSYSYTPAPTPMAQSPTSASSRHSTAHFHFRSSSIVPQTRSTSPLPTSPFQVLDAEDEERMHAIQQLAKRRRSSLLQSDSTSAYSVPSPLKEATSISPIHTSFAQLSLRAAPAAPAAPRSEVVEQAALSTGRVPTSARRLFSLEVGSDGRENSRSSKKGSLKRAHDDDEDDYSQQRTEDELSNSGQWSSPAHVEEEKQQEPEPSITAPTAASPSVQPVVASQLFDKKTLRERPRRWTTGVMALQPQPGRVATGVSGEQTRAARPITPYVHSGSRPIKPAPRSLFLQTTEEDCDGSDDNTAFAFDSATSCHSSRLAAKRASLTSSLVSDSFLPLPPQSRPPTPLAPNSKRATLPATFRLSSLASLAESLNARTDAETEDDEEALLDDKQASGLCAWPAASPPQSANARSTGRAGSNEGRRRSLVMAGARALVGGAQF